MATQTGSRIILDLDVGHIQETGMIKVTRFDSNNAEEPGYLKAEDVSQLFNKLFHFVAASKKIRVLSRFDHNHIAYGGDDTTWVVIDELPPQQVYLRSHSNQAYHVALPRLVVVVGTYRNPQLFWTAAEGDLTPETILYPLLLGNANQNGTTCLGTTGLRCAGPADVPTFIRELLHARTHEYPNQPKGWTDELYARLEQGWDPSIGSASPLTLGALITSVQ